MKKSITNHTFMKSIKLSAFILVLGLLSSAAYAQTRTDAVKLFNAGLEEARAGNYDAAVSSFTQAISVSEQIGAEADDIKQKSENQIPLMYFSMAKEAYNTYQTERGIENLDAALMAFRQTVSVAEEYNNETVGTTSQRVIPQLYYQKSVLQYNEGNFEAADETIDKAITENENYALAYYQKAKIHKKLNDTDENGIIDREVDILMNWYDQAIAKADAANQTDVAERAREAAHDELVAVGVQHSENDEISEAVELLSKALTYNQESADAHYRLAEAYNKIDDFDNAITHARQALEYETGGPTDKAKIYFELGLAYQYQNNKSAACDAMSNAAYGQFKSNAEYKMEHELECGSTAN